MHEKLKKFIFIFNKVNVIILGTKILKYSRTYVQ